MKNFWKTLREWLRGPDIEVGQVWVSSHRPDSPFDESVPNTFEIKAIKDGWVRGQITNFHIDGSIKNTLMYEMSFEWLRFGFGLNRSVL